MQLLIALHHVDELNLDGFLAVSCADTCFLQCLRRYRLGFALSHRLCSTAKNSSTRRMPMSRAIHWAIAPLPNWA